MTRARWKNEVDSEGGDSSGGDGTGGASVAPLIRAQTLGARVILIGTLRLDSSSDTLFALLLRTLFSPSFAVSREVLMGELWPEQTENRQRANLRQALYKLRRLGVQIGLSGDVVELEPSQVGESFALKRTSDRFEDDVILGNDPFGVFLPGYQAAGDEFSAWLTDVREVIHADVRRVLIDRLKVRRTRADWMGAEALARWLLQFDPLNEEATLTIAECMALNGSKTEAVRILDEYLAELGADAGDIKLPATLLKRRLSDPPGKRRKSFAPAEEHFVGREELLADLTLAMRRAKWHDGSATILHGPPGIGKTRVTEELAKVAAIEGFRVVRAACRESDSQRPLSLFLDLVPELLELPGAMGCDPESMAVLRRLSGGGEMSTSQNETSDSARVGLSQTKESPPRDIGVDYAPPAPIRRAVVELLSAVSDERGMVVVLEDAHLIDEASKDAALDILERLDSMRVLLLITSRSKLLFDIRRETIQFRVSTVPVGPLPAAHCKHLTLAVSQHFASQVSDDLLEWFSTASEGNPLFLRCLIYHWLETGSAGGVPPTLSGVLEQRIDRLTQESLIFLQTAALLGPFATGENVGLALELPQHKVLAAIETLSIAGALNPKSERVVDTHELVARCALARLSPLTANILHERIASLLEAKYEADNRVDLLREIGAHLLSITEGTQLRDFVVRHEADLAQAGSPACTLRLIEAAIKADPSLAERNYLRKTRMRLELDSGEARRALELRPSAMTLPMVDETLGDELADDALTRVDVAYRADVFADSHTLVEFCVAIAGANWLADAIRCRAAEVGLIITSNLCEVKLAFACTETFTWIEEVSMSDPARLRVALLHHTIFGDRSKALTLAHRHLEYADSLEDSVSRYHAYARAGFAFRIVGTERQSVHAYLHAFDIATKLGLPSLLLYISWQLSQVYIDNEQIDQANYWNNLLRSYLSPDIDPFYPQFAYAHFCRMEIQRGDFIAASLRLEEFFRRNPKLSAVRAAAYSTALSMGTSLIQPDWKPSYEQIQVALDRHKATSTSGTSDFFTSVLIMALLRMERHDEAVDFAATYMKVRRELSEPSACLDRAMESLDIHRAKPIPSGQ